MGDQEKIVEPDNAIEENWRGQRIARDTELAERLAAETDDDAEASRRFEQEKEGPPPEDLPTAERP